MSDSPLPKNWREAIPSIVWVVLVFAAGFEGIAALVHGEWLSSAVSFAIMVGLTAMLIHWAGIKEKFQDARWLVAACMVMLVVVALSPFIEQQRWPFTVVIERENATELALKPPAAIKTVLRLQFYGDSRVPTEVGNSENIYHWYALYSAQIGISMRDKDGNEVVPPGGLPRFAPTWDVFIVLKQPTTRRQVVTSFSNPEKMGPSQIMGETDRSFIFHSVKEMPAGVLEIKAEQ